MHSTHDLSSDSFTIAIGERAATLDDVWPAFRATDRLGVVVRQPGGALGASTLILATITAFYDRLRSRAVDFFAYPDFFVFHVGGRFGDHGMFDIWPDHKEVSVPNHPESVLRALNDRAISRLLVDDCSPGEPVFERQTLFSADCIQTAIAYSATGRTDHADVFVTGNEATERYVSAVVDSLNELPDIHRDALRARRTTLMSGGRPVESYRRLSVTDALARLSVDVEGQRGQ